MPGLSLGILQTLAKVRSKKVKKAYLLAGSIGLLGLITPAVSAAETSPTVEAAESSALSEAVAQANPAESVQADDNSIAQVTSVSELSDVQPTDWAFQAVQSLVERYGCIEGYPDRTFRGNRAATRYELAAALNACLNAISERFVTAEDLATIRQLQEEFAAELATLRGRVDALEARTAELEANQFSTTTKLSGQAIIAPQYGSADGLDTNATMISRVQLDLNTSFNGDDLLFTQLEMGNGGEDTIGAATADSPFAEFSNPGAVDYAEVPSEVTLTKLWYTFKPAANLAVTFGPLVDLTDFLDANSYANDEGYDFSSGFFINNPLTMTSAAAGAGAVIDWNFGGGPFSLRAGYTAANATTAIANEFGGGLFGDPYQGTVEAEYAAQFSETSSFAVRLQYTGAAIEDVKYSTYGVNAEATLGRFGIFGRYGRGTLDGYGTQADVDLEPSTFMAGVGIQDLFAPGSLLAFAVGQPFIEDDIGDATQTNYEAFYRFAVNDNIQVTPTVMVITDANNNSQSPTVYQGVLRTTFSF